MTDPYREEQPARAEVDASTGPLVLEFGNDWCGHCQAAQPIIAEAFAGHAGIAHMKFADAREKRLGRSFGVKLWPTLSSCATAARSPAASDPAARPNSAMPWRRSPGRLPAERGPAPGSALAGASDQGRRAPARGLAGVRSGRAHPPPASRFVGIATLGWPVGEMCNVE